MARGRSAGGDGVQARTARGTFSLSLLLLSSFPLLLLLLPFSISPQSTADGRFRFFPQSTADGRLLVVPPGSGRSVYRSAAGPVHTGRYRALPLVVSDILSGLRLRRVLASFHEIESLFIDHMDHVLLSHSVRSWAQPDVVLQKKRENKKREKKREKKKRAKKRAKKREKPGSPTRYSSPVPHAIGRPHDSSSASDSFSLRYCTIPGNTRTARYIPVRQLTGTRTGRYRGYR
ncbi:hypothetical protein BHM03_00058005 [Ensete ventricosum]|nr:hypothetical protein BHM03_00058005 [Ensete ventricosum]